MVARDAFRHIKRLERLHDARQGEHTHRTERKRAKREPDDTLKSLAKIVRILECFSVNDRTLSLAEICRRTGLPKSTAHRFAATMREVGFLDQDKERDRYRLGLRLLEFGDIVLANLDVHREARPMVEALQRLTGQAVHLAVFDGMRAVVIHRADAASENAIASALIENAPVHCTSVGKAILAFQPAETVERVIASGSRDIPTARSCSLKRCARL